MKKILLSSLMILLSGMGCLLAQQIQYNNQYLVNRFSLSPAYAGSSGYFEGFANYRKSWLGVTGSPEIRGLNLNTAIKGNMGIGGIIHSEQTGIFRNTTVSLSYAYHLKINDAQAVSFGLSAGALDNRIDLSGSKSLNSNDPLITSSQNVRTMVFNANFGALYKFRNLEVGVALPQLVPSKAKNEAGTLYTLKMHNLVHASYSYDINKDWEVQPVAVLRKTASTDLFYEVAALGRYKEMVFAALTYRKGSSMALSLGGELYDRLVGSYSYEFAGGGMMAQSSGSHEITLGYLIGKNKNAVAPSDSKKPYYDWLNK